jgi:hypothetical protein
MPVAPKTSDKATTYQSANDAFYRAFGSADAVAMDALWAEKSAVFCCHPGWPPILTRPEIVASWAEIFSHGAIPDMTFVPRQMALVGGLGLVCGIEMVGSAHFACTNLFVSEAGLWRMVHHHAGPLAPGTFAQIVSSVDPGRNARH